MPILAIINIGIVQGAYGQSLGKFLTRTTLVAQARRRPEVAGVYRGIMRIGVPLALAFFAYSDFRGNDFQDSDAVGSVVFVLLFLSYALAIFDPKGRTFWDHVCKTGAIDVVIRERNAENDKPAPNVRRQNPM